MKSDPANYPETTLPYWAEQKAEVPLALQSVLARLGFVSSNPWLIFPFEGVGKELYQEYAVRRHGKQLEIAFAIPHEGHDIIRLDPDQCESLQFKSVLLYSEMTFVMKNRSNLTLHYNAVGDRKLSQLMALFTAAMVDPEVATLPVEEAWSARQELLRLTGVNLPESEAEEAMTQIHKYKWLEAERAGFDTWAVIQPGNPLRAAAIHWVRKYFSEFQGAVNAGSMETGIAS